jgi:hypothetical protein
MILGLGRQGLVAKRPNYGQERAERQRRKAARRDERLAAKADRRDKHRAAGDDEGETSEPTEASSAPASAAVAMPADAAAMRRLCQALAFVCGPEHAATLAVRRALETGTADDIARARAMFMQLGARDQRAALAIAAAAAPSPA